MKNRLLYEIVLIITIPVLLGLTYHAFIRDSSKRLAWIREKPVIEPVDSTDLFGKPEPKDVDTQRVDKIDSATLQPKNPSRTDGTKEGGNPNPTGSNPPDKVKTPSTKPDEAVNKARAVTYDQVVRLNADESVLFFDARNEHEFAEGTIPRAKNIFAMDFEKHIPYILGLPDKNVRIVVFCGGGECDLSHELSDKLIQFGFKKVFIYLGGYTEWKAKQGK